MKRLMMFACLLAATATAWGADYLLPETIRLTPDGQGLIIGERGAGTVSVRDFQGKELRAVKAIKKTGGFLGLFQDETTLPVTGIAAAPDGTLYYTADDGNEGRLFREDGEWVVTGNRPMTPTLSPDGKYVYVCNRFDANVQKYDAQTLELLATAPAIREANGCALGQDGKLLFVINMLPDDAAEPVKYVAAKVTIVDTATFKVLDSAESLVFAPTIEVSAGATVSPASGEEQDFSSAVTYTVTAEDGTVKTYAVSVAAKQSILSYDFEEWETTISMKGVNCGGKYSNLASWMPIYNKANIEVKEPKGWASVNGKTCSSFATTSNTWFQVPTTELIGKAYSGQYAVKLRNAAWDMHGVEPPRDARTDREYFSSNVPDIVHRSAGKLFLGSYSCDADGNETYTEGIEFASRPTALSGMYAYVQDVHDSNETGLVVIRILNDENGKVTEIGRGERRLSPSTSYTRFVVPIEYSVRDMRATKLQLMICSSNYASYSQADETRNIRTTDYLEKGVSTGAELTIDALSLLYE